MVLPDFLQSLLPKYPEGDPGAIRVGAAAWIALGDAVRTAAETLQGPAGATSTWSGPGRDAFDALWRDLKTGMDDLAVHLGDVGTKLRDYADALEKGQRKYNAALIEAGATAGVGLALTFVTFGGSDAAAAEVLSVELGLAVADVAEGALTLERVLSVALAALRALGPTFASNFGKGIAADLIGQELGNAYLGQSPLDLNYKELGIAGLLGGTLGLLDPKIDGLLAKATEDLSKPATLAAKMGAGWLEGSGVEASQEYLTNGEVNPGAVLIGGAGGAAIGSFRRLGDKTGPLSPTEQALGKSDILGPRTMTLDDAGRAAVPGDLWDQKPFPRGRTAESVIKDQLARTRPDAEFLPLAPNHPKIDAFDFADGTATSIKTIDPASASYATPSGFSRPLDGYAQTLQDYNGGSWAGVAVRPELLEQRELLIGLPRTGLEPFQVQALERLVTTYDDGDSLLIRLIVL